MTSFNRIVQLVLVVVLAVLCRKYLQLQEKYDELKVLCKTNLIENPDQITNSKNVGSNQRPRLNTAGSFIMQSSRREDKIDEGGNFQQQNGALDEYEPTFHNEVGGQDFTLTRSGVVSNENGIVHQTSSFEDAKLVERRETTHVEAKIVASIDPTRDVPINPTKTHSMDIRFTKEKSKWLGESHEDSSSTLNNLHNIEPSIIEDIHQSTRADNEARVTERIDTTFRDRNVDINKDDKTDDVTRDEDELQGSAAIQNPIELMSSELTEEKKLLVRQTSLEDDGIVTEDPNVYNYFDTDESTAVLNTGLYGDSLHPMTDSTEYTEEMDEYVCDHFSCDEEELYDDNNYESEAYNGILGTAHNNKKQSGNQRKISIPDYIMTLDKEELHQFMTQGTSAFCHYETQTKCHFQNLCYNTKEKDFVFFKGERSVLEHDQSENKNDDSHIFDKINLSTILGHNGAMFSVVTLPVSLVSQFSIGIIKKRAVAINRFKPDNIMHVLHDDILPLFQTVNDLKYPHYNNAFDVAIVFTDSYDEGNYFDLYSSLSKISPLSPWQHNKTYDMLCFSSLNVGLETSTVWYQYGFFQPQGPISTWQEDILQNIHKATDHLSLHFSSVCPFCSKRDYLVLLSRKDNRLILNEGELIMAITKSTRLKVMSVSLETHSLSAIITIIRLSKGVVGMHGSLLSLAVFLTPGSIVMELFPFAVNPSHYTPFKTFCDLPGSVIVYKSWANPTQANSVPHPDRVANEGGIRHLPKQLQSEIASQMEVPEHLCCDNPSWLYHIYQDTIVDVNAVVALIMDAIEEANDVMTSHAKSHDNPSSTFSKDIPGTVRNLQCEKATSISSMDDKSKHLMTSFLVSWDTPWVFNVDVSASREYKYELVIQEADDKDNVRRLDLPAHDLSYRFESTNKGSDVVYHVWVRVVGDKGDVGQGKFIRCS